jgi:hypothetical protein
MFINDDSRVVRMMFQIVASPTIVILMTLEVSFRLIENIYSTSITHDDHHMTIIIYLKYRPQEYLYVMLKIRWPTNIRLGLKDLPGTNTLAYLFGALVMKKKRFITLAPGGNVIKLFSFITDDEA